VSGRERIEEELRVTPGQPADLAGRSSTWTGGGEFANLASSDANLNQAAREALARGGADLAAAQELLRADGTAALLVVFEGLHGAGKYSTVEHLTLGLSRHGLQVVSVGRPSSEELARTFLWRAMRLAPRRGSITILDGSHYADFVTARVDTDWLDQRAALPTDHAPDFWAARFDDINAFERHLDRNGTKVVKFFLNVSREEQRLRFLSRLEDSDSTWSARAAAMAERGHWNDVMHAYEEAITATSTEWAPWYVIPADDRTVMEAFVVSVIVDAVRAMDLQWPTLSDEERQAQIQTRGELQAEANASGSG
jgi:PPK2 family polyphosphate:nucleotide phosphotransferase